MSAPMVLYETRPPAPPAVTERVSWSHPKGCV
jgi:hypothetical protein